MNAGGTLHVDPRPPIAQHRFTKITNREVEFSTKDLKEKRVVTTQYLIEEFVDALAAHVPDRYRHAVRRFGLLAPRAQCVTSAALFVLLGQKKRPMSTTAELAECNAQVFRRRPAHR